MSTTTAQIRLITSLILGTAIGAAAATPVTSGLDPRSAKTGWSLICPDMVNTLYKGILGRAPNASELQIQTNACLAQSANPEGEPMNFYFELQQALQRQKVQPAVAALTVAATNTVAPSSMTPTLVQTNVQSVAQLPNPAAMLSSTISTVTDKEIACAAQTAKLYRDVLGRDPDPGSRWATSACMQGNAESKIRQDLINSAEYKDKQTAAAQKLAQCKTMVTNVYQTYLRRAPEAAGLDGWAKECVNGMAEATMVSAIKNSAEYALIQQSQKPVPAASTSAPVIASEGTPAPVKPATAAPATATKTASVAPDATATMPSSQVAPSSATLYQNTNPNVTTPAQLPNAGAMASSTLSTVSTKEVGCAAQTAALYRELLGRDPEGGYYGSSWATVDCIRGVQVSTIRSKIMASTEYIGRQKLLTASPAQIEKCHEMVSDVFSELLNRVPTDWNGDTWTMHCLAGMPRTDMVMYIKSSQEYALVQAAKDAAAKAPKTPSTPASALAGAVTTAASSTNNDQRALCDTQIRGLYQELLGRAADEGGLAAWMNLCTSGTSMSDIRKGFLNSPEYAMKHPAASPDRTAQCTDIVKKTYRNVLEREGEPAGVEGWTKQCVLGLSEADLVRAFKGSLEYQLLAQRKSAGQ